MQEVETYLKILQYLNKVESEFKSMLCLIKAGVWVLNSTYECTSNYSSDHSKMEPSPLSHFMETTSIIVESQFYNLMLMALTWEAGTNPVIVNIVWNKLLQYKKGVKCILSHREKPFCNNFVNVALYLLAFYACICQIFTFAKNVSSWDIWNISC